MAEWQSCAEMALAAPVWAASLLAQDQVGPSLVLLWQGPMGQCNDTSFGGLSQVGLSDFMMP